MGLIDYVRLIRPGSHGTYLQVIITALYFTPEISTALIKSLILLYFLFNVFLYGGIYAINDVADINSDRAHSKKSKRPVASGKISVSSALFFSFILIAAGLAGAFILFGATIFYFFIAFLAVSLLYTFVIKYVPYLDLIGNTVTQPMRCLMALFVINYTEIPYLLLSAYFFLMFGVSCVKRIVEKDLKGWQSRKVSKYYSVNTLKAIQIFSFISFAGFMVADNFRYKLLYTTLIVCFAIFVFGPNFSRHIRSLMRNLLTQ